MSAKGTGPSSYSKIKLALVFFGVLLVPVIPFLLFADRLEPWIERLVVESGLGDHPINIFIAVVLLLASDIFLPIPSSLLGTFSGRVLGLWGGTIASWIGLNLSCWIGFAVARQFGWPLVHRYSGATEVKTVQNSLKRWGVWTLLLLRGVPVLAEASILLVGVYRVPSKKLWFPIVTANLGLALAYTLLGDFSSRHGWFGAAMALSVAIPLTLLAGWFFGFRSNGVSDTNVE